MPTLSKDAERVYLPVQIGELTPNGVAAAMIHFGKIWSAKEIQIYPNGEIKYKRKKTKFAIEIQNEGSVGGDQDSYGLHGRMVVVRVRT